MPGSGLYQGDFYGCVVQSQHCCEIPLGEPAHGVRRFSRPTGGVPARVEPPCWNRESETMKAAPQTNRKSTEYLPRRSMQSLRSPAWMGLNLKYPVKLRCQSPKAGSCHSAEQSSLLTVEFQHHQSTPLCLPRTGPPTGAFREYGRHHQEGWHHKPDAGWAPGKYRTSPHPEPLQ